MQQNYLDNSGPMHDNSVSKMNEVDRGQHKKEEVRRAVFLDLDRLRRQCQLSRHHLRQSR